MTHKYMVDWGGPKQPNLMWNSEDCVLFYSVNAPLWFQLHTDALYCDFLFPRLCGALCLNTACPKWRALSFKGQERWLCFFLQRPSTRRKRMRQMCHCFQRCFSWNSSSKLVPVTARCLWSYSYQALTLGLRRNWKKVIPKVPVK